MLHDDLAPKSSLTTESPAPQDAADYIKAGPGTWQPLSLVTRRVVGRIRVPGDGEQAS